MVIKLDNGMVLPEIDDELIAVRPYVTVIYYPDEEHKYRAWASREVTLFGSEELVGVDAVTTVDEQAIVLWGTAGEAEWAGSSGAYQMPEGAAMAPMDTCELVWANHDIYKIASIDRETGSFTVSDEIYFADSTAPAYADEYRVKSSFLVAMAEQARRLTGKSGRMTTEQIQAGLESVVAGGSGENSGMTIACSVTASVLPVAKFFAASTVDMNKFEITSAVAVVSV